MLKNFKQQQCANQNLFHTASAAKFTEQKNRVPHVKTCWAVGGVFGSELHSKQRKPWILNISHPKEISQQTDEAVKKNNLAVLSIPEFSVKWLPTVNFSAVIHTTRCSGLGISNKICKHFTVVHFHAKLQKSESFTQRKESSVKINSNRRNSFIIPKQGILLDFFHKSFRYDAIKTEIGT